MNPEGCSVGGERVLSPSTQTTSCGSGRGSGPKGALGQTKSSMISPGGAAGPGVLAKATERYNKGNAA